jgi:hypothetical protein
MLIHETYSYIGHLFLLARIAEKQILLSSNTCMKNVTHDYQFFPLYMLIKITK